MDRGLGQTFINLDRDPDTAPTHKCLGNPSNSRPPTLNRSPSNPGEGIRGAATPCLTKPSCFRPTAGIHLNVQQRPYSTWDEHALFDLGRGTPRAPRVFVPWMAVSVASATVRDHGGRPLSTTVADLIGGVCSGIGGLWLGGAVSTTTRTG